MSRSFGPPLLLGPALLASAAVTAGLAVTASSPSPTPREVRSGLAVHLPDAGQLSPRARLVSARAADLSDVRPDDVGCTFRTADGHRRNVFVTIPAPGEEVSTVSGAPAHPLLDLARWGSGTTMVCTGAAIDRYGPVHLVPDTSAPARRVALAVGALLLAVTGSAATLFGRRRRSTDPRLRRPAAG